MEASKFRQSEAYRTFCSKCCYYTEKNGAAVCEASDTIEKNSYLIPDREFLLKAECMLL